MAFDNKDKDFNNNRREGFDGERRSFRSRGGFGRNNSDRNSFDRMTGQS